MATHATAARRPFALMPGGLRVDPLAIAAAIPIVLILILLGAVARLSFQETIYDDTPTVRHFAELATDPAAAIALRNTALFAVLTAFWAMVFGLPIAWLVERSDLGKKAVVSTMMSIGVVIPGFIYAMGWIVFAHPRSGLLTKFVQSLGLEHSPIDLLTIPAMSWVEGMSLAPVVFILTGASLRSMDASLEDSAQMCGAGFLTRLRAIILPLVLPGLVGAAIYVVTIALSSFDVPLVIGLSNRIYVFSTYLYTQVQRFEGPPAYEVAAAFSFFMVAFGVVLAWLYGRVLVRARTFQIVTGKGYRPRLTPLGRLRSAAWLFLFAYLSLAVGLPLLVLLWTSFLPFPQLPSERAFSLLTTRNYTELNLPLIGRAVRSTVLLMLFSPCVALGAAMAISWFVLRTRSRLRFVFDFVAFLPHAVPRIVFAFGAVMLTIGTWVVLPIDVYGSLGLLVLVMALVQLPFATRLVNASMIQIHSELEEAARTAGATTLTVLRRVTVPLIRPALVYGWVWLSLLAYRELTLPTMLRSGDNITLSAVIYDNYQTGLLGPLAALVVLMLLVLVPLVALYWRVGGSRRPTV
ncbi:MAG TPA: iron ABC transporter permease [Candidatus Limnocylindria bacterium]|nr:iron ABC transporter permease [Candidatus Limnocylindria bacterium]